MGRNTNDQRPLVSVVIPTHNRAGVLARALTSLTNQTYNHLDVIVIDDASTDDTHAMVKSFERHLDLHYSRNEKNLGIARTRNAGLHLAKGEYIALLDDDDEFLENKIEEQVKVALSLGYKAFITCSGHVVDGTCLRVEYDSSKPTGIISMEEGVFPIRCGIPPPSSWFFHKDALRDVGFFDERMLRWEDIDFSLRMMKKYPVYMINRFLVKRYMSADSLTGMSEVEIESREYFLRKHYALMRQDRDYFYQFHWRMGKDLREVGQPLKAIKYYWDAFVRKPHRFESLGWLLICALEGLFIRQR